MHDLRVNGTKVTSRNTFIGNNLFALESDKESKYNKRAFLETVCGSLIYLLTIMRQMPHI